MTTKGIKKTLQMVRNGHFYKKGKVDQTAIVIPLTKEYMTKNKTKN